MAHLWGFWLVLGIVLFLATAILADPIRKGAKGMSAGLTRGTETTASKSSYTVWCVDLGSGCDKDVAPQSRPGVVLMGGGTDTDEAFLWQIERASGGDFVVLRASGDDAYNQWILDMSVAAGMPLNSVRTILFNTAEASSDPVVLDLIRYI
jgi:cyanophycinase